MIDSRVGRVASRRGRVDFVPAAWRWLLSPWTLLTAGSAILFLLPAAFLLPQLPGQLNDEPAAAARWLLAAGASYGALGNAFREIGLFNVLHSFSFRALLAFLTLLVALHFADSLGKALALQTLIARFGTLAADSSAPGAPAPLPDGLAVYRTRRAVDAAPSAVTARLTSAMRDMYGYLAQNTVHAGSENEEMLLLGVRRRYAYALQALSPLGLLLALAAIWLFLLAGWHISSPVLAPGEAYRAPAQDLLIHYLANLGAEETVPAIAVSVHVGGKEIIASAPSDARLYAEGVSLHVQREGTGLLVRATTAEPLLALPGQVEPSAGAGIILPSPGSEESVLLPTLSGGLRVVRPADGSESLLIEVYRGLDLEPEQRIVVTGRARHEIGPEDQSVLLEFIPLPGLRVVVRHLPGLWLIWPAVLLLLTGAAGYASQPAFALVQIAPWPAGRAVVVIQTPHLRDFERLSLDPLDFVDHPDIEPSAPHRE